MTKIEQNSELLSFYNSFLLLLYLHGIVLMSNEIFQRLRMRRHHGWRSFLVNLKKFVTILFIIKVAAKLWIAFSSLLQLSFNYVSFKINASENNLDYHIAALSVIYLCIATFVSLLPWYFAALLGRRHQNTIEASQLMIGPPGRNGSELGTSAYYLLRPVDETGNSNETEIQRSRSAETVNVPSVPPATRRRTSFL